MRYFSLYPSSLLTFTFLLAMQHSRSVCDWLSYCSSHVNIVGKSLQCYLAFSSKLTIT